jgi:hypothetical protein
MGHRQAVPFSSGEIQPLPFRVEHEQRGAVNLKTVGQFFGQQGDEPLQDNVGRQLGAHLGEEAPVVQFGAEKGAVNQRLHPPAQWGGGQRNGQRGDKDDQCLVPSGGDCLHPQRQ